MMSICKKILLIVAASFLFAEGAGAVGLGSKVDFNVDSEYDKLERTQITATLRAIGNYAYFYVEDDYWNELDGTNKNGLRERLEDLAVEFDNVIYPKERAIFGSEWSPGIDNDPKITVLITQLTNNAGGYINILDEFPKTQVAVSNEREMIYLNTATTLTTYLRSFLAHEFQHLITFYQKSVLYGKEEDVWLNEARSEYAPTLCGYNNAYAGSYLADRVDLLLDYPTDPLGEWKNESRDYGVVSLFLHYLVDHYGEQILTRMIMSDKVGIESINQALVGMGYIETLSDIFANWTVANYFNDCTIGDEYCYLNSQLTYQRLHVDPSATYSGFPNLVVTRSSSAKDWSPRWYQFSQNVPQATDRDALKLEFSGSGSRSDFIIPYAVISPYEQTTIGFLSIDGSQTGEIFVPDFTSQNKSVVIMPFNSHKQSGFSDNEQFSSFTFTASSIANSEIPEEPELFSDGALIRNPSASGLARFDIYIIKLINGKRFKRLILSPHVFESYGHLHWEDVNDVDQSVMDLYTTSDLVRAQEDSRVYQLSPNGDTGTKQWLNMTADAFLAAGYDPDSIYEINIVDRDAYAMGNEL